MSTTTSATQLVAPDVRYRDAYLAGFDELTTTIERQSWLYQGVNAPIEPPADFEQYVKSLLLRESVAPPGFVRDTILWAINNDELVGRIALRHELNESLAKWGGHIGYIVRPSYRRQGIATAMLQQLLQTERAKQIGRLLVTCDEGNIASEKTIVNNGGVYESTIAVDADNGIPKKRFWIHPRDVEPPPHHHGNTSLSSQPCGPCREP